MVSRLFPPGLKPAIMLFCMCLVLASGPSFAQKQPPGNTAPVPPPPPLLLGAAWYPEQWPESRWNADLDLMQKAHMHLIRIGEFSWSKLEPEEGMYDLDWMERVINLAGQHGIYVVIGTPSCGPPQWLAFASSNLIQEGKITTDAHGGVPYGGHQFTALVFIRSEEHTSELQSLRHIVCRL